LYFPVGCITNVIGNEIEHTNDKIIVNAIRSGDLCLITNLFLARISLITKNKCTIRSSI